MNPDQLADILAALRQERDKAFFEHRIQAELAYIHAIALLQQAQGDAIVSRHEATMQYLEAQPA
jgi:hypothetical protein